MDLGRILVVTDGLLSRVDGEPIRGVLAPEDNLAALDSFLDELLSLPPAAFALRTPCPDERIRQAESWLGTFPEGIVGMLQSFNGAELFIDTIALVTVFGLSVAEDDPACDWFIDRFTPTWRSRIGRPHDLVIGMFSYGGIVTIGTDSLVREWDSVQWKWSSDHDAMPLDSWIEMIAAEGRDYLANSP